jgi:hypothetical protein
MASNNEIITEALSIIGVLAEMDSISAEQGETGLSVMNDLLMEWDSDEIDVGYYPQTDVNAESPIYADALQAVKYNLALALSNYYGVEPRLPVIVIADRGYKRLLRDSIISKMKEADLTHLPGVISRYNILDG